jgi:hypothetical protein
MNKTTKIVLGILGATAVGGGFLYFKGKADKAQDPTDPSLDPTITPTPSVLDIFKPKKAAVIAPAATNYDVVFTKADKAHVMIMQKIIGVVPDGNWGPATEAALPKALKRPFTLNQLQTYVTAAKALVNKAANLKKTGLKVGDTVFAAYTTDVEVTKDAKFKNLKWTTTGAKRIQEVQKGQLLGKIVLLNPNSVLVLNAFNELVLASYGKLSKTQLAGLGAAGVNLL